MIKKKIITYLSLAFILLSGTIGVFVGLHNKNKDKEEILVFDESETPVITNNNVEHNLRMRNVGDVLTVVASITPEDATVQNVSWSFVEEGVTGKLTIISQDGLTCRVRKEANYAGYYTLQVTTQDNNKTATCKIYSTNYVSEFMESPFTPSYANNSNWTLRFQLNKASDPARHLDTVPLLTESNINSYFSFDNSFKELFDITSITNVNMAYTTTSLVERVNFQITTKSNFLDVMRDSPTKTVSVTVDNLTATFDIVYVAVQSVSLNISETNI